jgi:hypothetical protein
VAVSFCYDNFAGGTVHNSDFEWLAASSYIPVIIAFVC